tara:strand:- start:65 stop:871 length:807 start_codon:yes stop_codon:yes gene_type:complete
VSILVKIIVFLVFVTIVFFLYIKHLQTAAIFFPIKELETIPGDYPSAPHEISIETDDEETLSAWFLSGKRPNYTLLYLHGNGGNISHRLDKIEVLLKTGANVFIVDYRGYGESTGKPSEKGLYLDAKAAYEHLNKIRIPGDKIILYGESLGGAVAIDLATKFKTRAIIIEGAFSSAKDMGRIFYPFIPPILLPDIFDSFSKIKEVNIPKLFIHSQDDEIVPFSLAEKLYENATQPKKLIKTKGGHNSGYVDSFDLYLSSIYEFIAGLD